MMSPSTPVMAAGTGSPAYCQTFPCAPETAVIGRRLVRDALGAWHLADLTDPAALIISELIANAAEHTSCRSIRLTVGRPSPAWVRVGVMDRAPGLVPELRPVADDMESGRGLLLVDALADRWGYDLRGIGGRPWGKEVWGELRVGGR
ncbi:ATP-binding protein [Streptomyces sp. NPDC052051]|uniref:ATP-binding protein n=1 Tax=Streptomyces sp. NPDC052051 TaxID=3154649 RepID=UPI003439E0DE